MPHRHPHHPVQRRCLSRIGAATSLALLLAACGGSDGSPPVISTQPQSLTVAEGGQGSVSVTATSDAGDITYQWFNVSGNANIVGATAASHAFGPVSLAAAGTQYDVRLSNALGTTTSATGTLSVIERSWSAASALASGVRQIASVIDSNGHTHVLAITGNNLQRGVSARIKLKNADSTQTNAFTDPGNGALQPLTAVTVGAASIKTVANGAGHVMAVWAQNGIVGAALYTPGPNATTAGSWQLLPTRVNSFSANSVSDPVVAAVGNDGFEFIWRERIATTGVHNIMARRYHVGANFYENSVSIENSSAETGAPRVVSDTAGNVLAAWNLAGQGVVINRRAALTDWGTDLTLIDGTGNPLMALRANPSGKAVALTSDGVGSAFASRLDAAASVVLLQSAAAVANAYGSAPDAFVDTADRIHVFGVSVNSDNGDSRLFKWDYIPGTGWGAPEAVSDISARNFIVSGGLGLSSPNVAGADAEGNYVVTWNDVISNGDGSTSRVYARRFHAGLNQWRATASLADGNGQPPLATVAADGSATIVFPDVSGSAVGAMNLH